jgi:hypothetical protein
MKRFTILILFLSSILCLTYSQEIIPGGPGTTVILAPITPSHPLDKYPTALQEHIRGGFMTVVDTAGLHAITDARRQEGQIVYVLSDKRYYQLSGGITNDNWIEAVLLFDASQPIIREDWNLTGQVISGTNVVEVLKNLFYPALVPLSSISGGLSIEYGDPNISRITSFTITKRTYPIIDIKSDGITISDLITGGTQSGTFLHSLTQNVNSSASIWATDDHGMTTSNETSFYYKNRYYYGTIDHNTSITSTDILTLSSFLYTNRSYTFNSIGGDGKYVIWAFPESWGDPIFWVGGFINDSFSETVMIFTNQFGYVETYQVWISPIVYNESVMIEIK